MAGTFVLDTTFDIDDLDGLDGFHFHHWVPLDDSAGFHRVP